MGRLVEMTGLPHYYMIVACLAGLVAVLAANKVGTLVMKLDRVALVMTDPPTTSFSIF